MKPEVLRRPFPPELVKTRQGHNGKSLSYVETWAVIERLNEGCDAWSFEITEHHVFADDIVVVGKLTADGVVKMAFGGASITRDRAGKEVSIADDLKSAASDALKKAASLLGVALELYGGPPAAHEQRPDHRHEQRTEPVRVPTVPRPDFDRLTARQLGAIHSAARRLGLDLASFVRERTGKDAPQHLSKREASDLLSELSNTNGDGH